MMIKKTSSDPPRWIGGRRCPASNVSFGTNYSSETPLSPEIIPCVYHRPKQAVNQLNRTFPGETRRFRGQPVVQSDAMRPMIRRPAPIQSRLSSFLLSWQLALPCLLLCACSLGTNVTPVGQGPLGTVALERHASRGTTAKYGTSQTFQASHPAHLTASLTERLLTGLSVSGLDRPGSSMAQESYPLFTHEEVEFLVPLIVTALAQAQPDQRVRFTMQDDGLTTQGTLYVYKTTLRVNLSHYRSTSAYGQTRPGTLKLSFTPSQGLEPADTPQPWMIVEPEQPRIAVSLEALSQLPAPSPVAAASTQTSPAAEQSRLQQELQSTKDVVVKQAEELQTLKAELESIRRQLAEKDAAASKTKPKAAPRKPTATP